MPFVFPNNNEVLEVPTLINEKKRGNKKKKPKKSKTFEAGNQKMTSKEEEKPSKERFECSHCGYRTQQKISLKRHLLSKHSETRHRCHCGKTYKWEVDLRRHQEAAHSDQTFPCSECQYQGTSRRNLSVHLRQNHSTPRPKLDCPICGDNLRTKASLQLHISLTHLKEGQVSCEECGQDLSSKSVLTRHMKEKHRGDQPGVVCPLCQKSFSRKSSMARHLKISHVSDQVQNED